MPRIDLILNQLHGKCLFTALDICNGYNNIRVQPKDQWKLAFKGPDRHYMLRSGPKATCQSDFESDNDEVTWLPYLCPLVPRRIWRQYRVRSRNKEQKMVDCRTRDAWEEEFKCKAWAMLLHSLYTSSYRKVGNMWWDHRDTCYVRLKLAFCMTCAVWVLVLAQGPSFWDSRGPC